MKSGPLPLVRVSDLGDVVHFSCAFERAGSEEKAREAAIRAAHELVYASARTAAVEFALYGRHGGAFVDGVVATVRFS